MSDPTTAEIEVLPAREMSEADLRGICELHHEAFFRAERSLAQRIEIARGRWLGDFPEGSHPRAHVVRDGDRIVAVAIALVRTLETEAGPMTVLGLSGVATAATHRGQGLGQRVIGAAWRPVDERAYPLCLFQTGKARGLYERLGARVVGNRFVDSTNTQDPQANPFTDEVAMIYPGDADWPDGMIDLRGPGY
ncbi:MAG: GNAT family N-acetyltransferase [Planctomycetota bacterium]